MVTRSIKTVPYAIGSVHGPNGQENLVCQFVHMTNSQGCAWFGGDPFDFSLPVLLFQIVLIFLVTNTIWLLLKPAKQGLVSAQLLGGIILGRSFMGHIKGYRDKIYPHPGRLILETFADVGFMFHLFILGVHIDVSLLKRVTRKIVVIGTTCFAMPLILGWVLVFFLPRIVELEDSLVWALPIVSGLNAISSFPVITSLLTDLKILNSEIGRIATLASMVSDVCNYILSLMMVSMIIWVNTMQWNTIFTVISGATFLLVIILGFRPIITQIAKRVPDGQQMKESQFISIVLIVLLCGLGAEVSGQPAALGTFILGVVIPDGPPLDSSLVNKLDTICTGLLVPTKLAISGLNMNLFAIGWKTGSIYGLVVFICYVCKFAGTLIPALYYKIPLRDAVTLALIMCCKGIIEAALYIAMVEDEMINSEAYAILIISMLIVTGIARPVISYIYDPSAKYLGQQKNSILGNNPSDELRFLVCIHNEEHAQMMIDLLDAAAPMRNRPIAVFVLNLMELKGRGASMLEASTHKRSKLSSIKSWPKHVANAFNLFAQRNHGSVVLRHFTSVAPYASMHNDICTIALDQDANIVIVPFHKQYTIDGRVGSNSPSIRMVNQNVIEKSPCSVGVLVDRGQVASGHSVYRGHSMFNITVLFLGGADDCEALAYSSRFIDNPEINLTFVWIRPWDNIKYGEELDILDVKVVDQFRAKTIGNERVVYKEEIVKDAIETTRVFRSVEDCDLCMVGRYHEPNSPILLGFTDWSEFPELGLVGDMLVTSDFKFSVLVVQQQPQATDSSINNRLQPIASVASYSSSSSSSQEFLSFQ